MRWLPLAALVIGFPAWMVGWMESPHVLVYLYALLFYVAVMGIATAVATGVLDRR